MFAVLKKLECKNSNYWNRVKLIVLAFVEGISHLLWNVAWTVSYYAQPKKRWILYLKDV